MKLKFTTTILLSGLVYGVVMGVLFAMLIAQPVLEIIRSDASPNDFILRTDGFGIFMTYGIPVIIIVFCIIFMAPLCGSIHEIFMNQGLIFGLNPRILYILAMLALTSLFDVLVIVSGITFLSERMLMNLWTFVMLGIVIGLT